MEGKPTIPGLGPEAPLQSAETPSTNEIQTGEPVQRGEAEPAIQPRFGETVPPPSSELSNPTRVETQPIGPISKRDIPILSADSVGTKSVAELAEILEMRFEDQAPE